MKRFIVSVLCTAVFFIGLGGLIEKTSAKFKSDEKALAIIAQARQAIGGDANIKNVRSMTITGNTTHSFEAEGVQRNETGSLEINFELPGKFSRMTRIGNPANGAGEAEFNKTVDVLVMRKDGDSADLKDLGDGEKKVFVIKKADGAAEGGDLKVDGTRRIIVKKDDGTIREIKPGDKDAVFFERESGIPAAPDAEGRRILVDKELRASGAPRQNEMLRTVFALLLSAPEGTEAEYLYAGESAVDGFAVDIIDVQSAGSAFKLYLDKSSHLPRMLSYMGMPMMKVVKLDKAVDANVPRDNVKVFVRDLESGKGEPVEHQVKFSDFRFVGGLQLPFRWAETTGGNASETVEISNYEINPANIADKFQNQKVFVRQLKPKQ